MSKWQPIETAPKTGDAVLLWKPDERAVGEYTVVGYYGQIPQHDGHWVIVGGSPLGYFSTVANADQDYPTHWQPLPEPPQ